MICIVFFYMDKDVLENIKKEHVEITTSYSISDIVSCLRFYAKEFKDYSAYKKVEDYTKEKKHSIFRINIERLNMPSVFLSVL